MISVVIADDHPLIQEGIKKVLQDEIDISLTEVAHHGEELLSVLEKEVPDILILDMDMPGTSGIAFLKHIQGIYPKLPVLVLSVHPAKRYAVRTLQAGAKGYLHKNHMARELVKAIRKIVQQKRRYVPSDVGEQLATQANKLDAPLHETLSDREFEVLCKISQGMNVKSISEELSLSTDTIYTYRSRIMEKTGFKTDVEMARYAMENNLID